MTLKKGILAAAVTLWAVATGVGTVWITDYASRPGPDLSQQNLRSSGPGPAGHSRLLIFLHPYCPCSRATLAELARLSTRNAGSTEVEVRFYKPEGELDEWVKTDLWRTASAMPDVVVTIRSEDEIRKFGTIVSGQALLYDEAGQLVFSGGITAGRGHEGDNAGRKSIESYLLTGSASVSESPVYGCVLTTAD